MGLRDGQKFLPTSPPLGSRRHPSPAPEAQAVFAEEVVPTVGAKARWVVRGDVDESGFHATQKGGAGSTGAGVGAGSTTRAQRPPRQGRQLPCSAVFLGGRQNPPAARACWITNLYLPRGVGRGTPRRWLRNRRAQGPTIRSGAAFRNQGPRDPACGPPSLSRLTWPLGVVTLDWITPPTRSTGRQRRVPRRVWRSWGNRLTWFEVWPVQPQRSWTRTSGRDVWPPNSGSGGRRCPCCSRPARGWGGAWAGWAAALPPRKNPGQALGVREGNQGAVLVFEFVAFGSWGGAVMWAWPGAAESGCWVAGGGLGGELPRSNTTGQQTERRRGDARWGCLAQVVRPARRARGRAVFSEDLPRATWGCGRSTRTGSLVARHPSHEVLWQWWLIFVH